MTSSLNTKSSNASHPEKYSIGRNSGRTGDAIISQGEKGDVFYILEEGQAKAVKDGSAVKSYQKGDYFGELALIHDEPRTEWKFWP